MEDLKYKERSTHAFNARVASRRRPSSLPRISDLRASNAATASSTAIGIMLPNTSVCTYMLTSFSVLHTWMQLPQLLLQLLQLLLIQLPLPLPLKLPLPIPHHYYYYLLFYQQILLNHHELGLARQKSRASSEISTAKTQCCAIKIFSQIREILHNNVTFSFHLINRFSTIILCYYLVMSMFIHNEDHLVPSAY